LASIGGGVAEGMNAMRGNGPLGLGIKWNGPFSQGVALGCRVFRLRRWRCGPKSALEVRSKRNHAARCGQHRGPEGAEPDSPGQRPGDGIQSKPFKAQRAVTDDIYETQSMKPIVAPKGPNPTAQGNALGTGRPNQIYVSSITQGPMGRDLEESPPCSNRYRTF
jgi:hypothetical protein